MAIMRESPVDFSKLRMLRVLAYLLKHKCHLNFFKIIYTKLKM